MTSEPFAYNPGTAADVFAQQAASVYRRDEPIGNTYRVLGTGMENGRRVRYWELTLRDFSGGQGPLTTSWKQGGLNNVYATNEGMDASIPGYLIPTRATNSDATPLPTGDLQGLHHANIFDDFIMGIGSGTNVSLAEENISGAGVVSLSAITYNPTGTSSICSLGTAVIGGTTTDRRLIVGLNEDPAQIVGDATGTVDATMHADTERLWGLVQTWLPGASGFVIQLYSGGASGAAAIRTLLTSDATGTQPTVATADLPNGGFAIADHELSLSGAPPRTYWVLPKEDLGTNSMLKFGAEKLGYVTSFDLYGKDAQTLAFNDMPNGVSQACPCYGYDGQLGVAATDGQQLVWHDGVREYNLGWLVNRAEELTNAQAAPDINSNYAYRIRGLRSRGSRLYYRVSYYNRIATADVYTWWEFYDFSTDAIHVLSDPVTEAVNSSAAQGVLSAGSMPFSYQSQHLWAHDNAVGFFYSTFVPFPGENPYWIHRRSSSGDSATGQTVITPSNLSTPQWQLPDTIGYLSCVDEVAYGGDFPGTHNTDATTAVQWSQNNGTTFLFAPPIGTAWTFKASDRIEERIRRGLPEAHKFSKFSVRFELTRGSTVTSFHNALPVVFRGRTFLS